MTDQSNKKSFFSQIKDQIIDLAIVRLKLLQIILYKEGARLIAPLISMLILVVVFLLVVMFSSVLAAIYFSKLLQSSIYGYGIVTAFYFLLFIILLVFRNPIMDRFFTNFISKIWLKKDSKSGD